MDALQPMPLLPFLPFLPDFLLLGLAFALLGAEMAGGGARALSRIAWIGFAAAFAAQAVLGWAGTREAVSFGGYAASQPIGLWKQVFLLAGLGAVFLSRPYFRAGGMGGITLDRPGAYHALLVFSVLGMFALASARDLLVFFIGLELAALPLYALVAFKPSGKIPAEAGFKFILFGAFSSALVLMAISLLYGASGTLTFDGLSETVRSDARHPILRAGAILLFGGLGFKLAMAPMHMWAPDAYEGAPTPVAAFLAMGSKAGAAASLATLFLGPLEPMRASLSGLFLAAGVLSLAAGSFGAMGWIGRAGANPWTFRARGEGGHPLGPTRQGNVRRFLAYSSISQAGYLVLALLAEKEVARVALLYNLVAHGLATYAFFFVFAKVGRPEDESLDAFRGLGRAHPALAILLAMALFSMVGLPPLAGFLGKFLIFSAVAAEGRYLAVTVALANAALSFYYYMEPVRRAFRADGGDSPPGLPSRGGKGDAWIGWGLAAALVAAGATPYLVRYLR